MSEDLGVDCKMGLLVAYNRELKWPLSSSVRIYRHQPNHQLCFVGVTDIDFTQVQGSQLGSKVNKSWYFSFHHHRRGVCGVVMTRLGRQ